MYSEELHEYWKAHLGDSSWKHMNLSVSQDSMRDLLDEIERLQKELVIYQNQYLTREVKAWIGRVEGEEWVMPIHGKTAGKAKAFFLKCSPVILEASDFLFVRLRRLPALDDKPFTPENLEAPDWHYVDEDGEDLSNENFINDCSCEVCRKAVKV
ncbi:MAG: hypothetical protein C0401_06575 [Anaerolinea sp.]|nr:hypothetical protein [Anaerolinea sp.]